MSKRLDKTLALFVSDIDNTLFDWVSYYVHAFSALLSRVASITSVPEAQLAEEAKQVFSTHGSIEYPFLIQELPSVVAQYGDAIDAMLNDVVAPGRRRWRRLGKIGPKEC